MAFKLFIIAHIFSIGLAAALDYNYNNPNGVSTEPTQQQINNVANDINSFSAATTIDDSEATPVGYDYSAPHTTTPQSQIRVQQQQQQIAPVTPLVYWPPAKYDFSYAVNDAYSGDIKSHTESSDGYLVRGQYSVVDPDGYERIVTYTADDVHGFNAIVKRKPYVTNILKSTPVIEYHNKETSATATVAKTQQNNNNDQRDSYASPPTQQQQNEGPYP